MDYGAHRQDRDVTKIIRMLHKLPMYFPVVVYWFKYWFWIITNTWMQKEPLQAHVVFSISQSSLTNFVLGNMKPENCKRKNIQNV